MIEAAREHITWGLCKLVSDINTRWACSLCLPTSSSLAFNQSNFCSKPKQFYKFLSSSVCCLHRQPSKKLSGTNIFILPHWVFMSQIIHLIFLQLFYLWAKFCNWKSPESIHCVTQPFYRKVFWGKYYQNLIPGDSCKPHFVSHSTLVLWILTKCQQKKNV